MTGSEPPKIGVKKKRWVVCFENTILDLDLSIYEKMVYIILCSHAKKDGPCYPSIKKIAEESSCSRTKVFEALRTLEERGIIARGSQIYDGRGQTSNLYEIIDIIPRPQDGPGGPCDERAPSATRTGGVREADPHIKVLEQDHMNKTKEHSPPTPQGAGKEGGEGEDFETKKPEIEALQVNDTGKRNAPALSMEPEICSYEAIVEVYNATLPELAQAGKITSFRVETLRRRIAEDPERRELDWWRQYFCKVREFSWPMGDNPKGWRADFDWLTGDRGMQKILEGSFRRSQGSRGRTQVGAEIQKRYTNERGEVVALALLLGT
jgi:DNA-binding Lrp family transcriptional regulator